MVVASPAITLAAYLPRVPVHRSPQQRHRRGPSRCPVHAGWMSSCTSRDVRPYGRSDGTPALNRPGRRVGEVADATGLTVRTLHHFDEIGVLVASDRTEAGHRLYSDADVERLYRICLLRRLGLPLSEIGRGSRSTTAQLGDGFEGSSRRSSRSPVATSCSPASPRWRRTSACRHISTATSASRRMPRTTQRSVVAPRSVSSPR